MNICPICCRLVILIENGKLRHIHKVLFSLHAVSRGLLRPRYDQNLNYNYFPRLTIIRPSANNYHNANVSMHTNATSVVSPSYPINSKTSGKIFCDSTFSHPFYPFQNSSQPRQSIFNPSCRRSLATIVTPVRPPRPQYYKKPWWYKYRIMILARWIHEKPIRFVWFWTGLAMFYVTMEFWFSIWDLLWTPRELWPMKADDDYELGKQRAKYGTNLYIPFYNQEVDLEKNAKYKFEYHVKNRGDRAAKRYKKAKEIHEAGELRRAQEREDYIAQNKSTLLLDYQHRLERKGELLDMSLENFDVVQSSKRDQDLPARSKTFENFFSATLAMTELKAQKREAKRKRMIDDGVYYFWIRWIDSMAEWKEAQNLKHAETRYLNQQDVELIRSNPEPFYQRWLAKLWSNE